MAYCKTRCPHCQRKLILPKAHGKVRCPKCAHRFEVNAQLGADGVSLVAMRTVPPTASASTAAHESHADGESVGIEIAAWRPGPILAIAAASALVLGLAVWLSVWSWSRPSIPAGAPPEPLVNQPIASKSKPAETPMAAVTIVTASSKNEPPPAQQLPAQVTPFAGAVKPIELTGAAHPGVDQAKVAQAIQRGAGFLAASQRNGNLGAEALAGLTLLHCGRQSNDPAVAGIARLVRSRAPVSNQTYELATCVLFLDRLGEAADHPLIRAMALQLIAGQGIMGGWNYGCQPLDAVQQRELLKLLEGVAGAARETSPAAERVPGATRSALVQPKGFGGRTSILPKNLAELPVLQYQPGTHLKHLPHGHEDNSLTQFAILALWAAQKHGIPAERSLAFVEARFRSSQAEHGAWSYTWSAQPRRERNDSMTCAGLLGLAVGRGSHAVSKDAQLERGDVAIEKGLLYVGQRIGTPGANNLMVDDQAKAREELRVLQAQIAQANAQDRTALREKLRQLQLSGRLAAPQRGSIVGADSWGDLYFLWTLERVAVAYDLKTIGGKDWYAWGAPILLAHQGADGSWREAHGAVPDTCFALLFLKRANVAIDLTARLQDLAISKQLVERTGADLPDRRSVDPFDRRPDLSVQQRGAAGYVRGLLDER